MKSNLLSLFLLAAIAPWYCRAEIVSIPVHASFVPTKATGILFTSRGIMEKIPATLSSNGEEYLVGIDIPKEQLKAGISATAYVINDEGNAAYGDVVQITPALSTTSWHELPTCDSARDPKLSSLLKHADESDIGALTAIRDFRIKKAANERSLIRETLTSNFVVKLIKLEKGLGLSSPFDKPLSSELPAAELANRLSAIKCALENYLNVQKKDR